jgi:poly(A) polymerase
MVQININFYPENLPRSPEVFIVGGTVRDILLGKQPSDYDLVTLGNPETLAGQIAAAYNSRVVRLGKPGTILLRIKTPDKLYDIVPALGGAIESDLHHRDFTITAMAVRLSDGVLVDLFNGLQDINQNCIRMISKDNLILDPIRLLRAYRMGAVLNFAIDSLTRDAVREEAHRIASCAPERIRDEFLKLLSAPSSSDCVNDMSDSGILTSILPEMSLLKECIQNKHHPDDALDHSLKSLSCIEDIFNHPKDFFPGLDEEINPLPTAHHISLMKFAILIHDIGKPHTRSIDEKGGVHFYSHEEKSAQISDIITRRLKFSNDDQRYVHDIIANHMRPLFLFLARQKGRLTLKSVNRFFLKTDGRVVDILVHAMADMKAKDAHADINDFMEFSNLMLTSYHREFKPLSILPPLINGNNLIKEFGLFPSPLMGRILNHIKEKRLQRLIYTREEALNEVKKFLNANHRS